MSYRLPRSAWDNLAKPFAKSDGTIINDDDVVEGIVLLRKGAVAETTLDALHQKIDQLNGTDGRQGLLPVGVKLVPHLDRSQLMHHTTHTVLRNLTDGVLLVTLILFLFLGNVRSALIVAITIPFSSAVRRDPARPSPYSREPVLARSSRLRNGRRRIGRDGRKHPSPHVLWRP